MIEPAERPDPLFDLAAEKDVGGRGEVVAEREILVDDLHALLTGLDWLVEMHWLASDADFAVSRQKVAGDDFDECRLAGAVVAHEAQHLPGVEGKIHLVQRVDRAEVLGNSL